MPLSDNELAAIVGSEESRAKPENSDLDRKREFLMDSYNQEPYGDEVPGQSSVVTSDVADVVESILPSLMRVFTQGKQVGKFESSDPENDKEAEQKTLYANWVLMRSNPGTMLLHSMFKDSVLQFTGTLKAFWDDSIEVTETPYQGVSSEELALIKADQETEIIEEEPEVLEDGTATGNFNVKTKHTTSNGKIKIDTIPPDQFIFADNARDFIDPRFIGQRTPKTRSQLIQMGFDKAVVDALPADDSENNTATSQARNRDDQQQDFDTNPSSDRANDIIMLGEYYMHVDVDEDGIAELYQIFYASDKVLEKTLVDEHPYAVAVSIPMPHRAVGTCPAEQVADLQLVKSVLVRHTLNNAYHVNYARNVVNERVDLDDLLTPVAGGIVRVDGEGPIGDSVMPLVVTPQIPALLQAIEYVDTMRETRTGITRFNQGLDPDSLNQTATGFKGLMGASQQREQLIARMLGNGVEVLFDKIINLAHKYQKDSTQIRVTGDVIEINPTDWREDMDCSVEVGLGSGDRQEKIANLNFIYQTQIAQMQQGLALSDQPKLYSTLEKLITEVGLKDVDQYFNNPERPIETVVAENEQLMQMVEQLQAQVQTNPLAEAELVKQQGAVAIAQGKLELEGAKLREKIRETTNDGVFDYDKLETENNVDIPGKGTSG